jgi:hypothetical protein
MDPKPIGPPARPFPITAHTAALSGRESSAITARLLALIAALIWLYDAIAVLAALAHW